MANTTEVEITPPGAVMTETPELATALDGAASVEEIRDIIAQEAARQNIVVPAKPAPVKEESKAEPEAKDDDAKFAYADDFSIGGKSYHFEGDSPAEINRQVKAAIAAHENATKPEPKQETTAAKRGLSADEKVALELDYRMGKIGLDEYLDKTGALDAYLEKKGVKVDQLKEVVEEKVSRKEVDAWATATEAFKQAHGADEWPGGDQNLKIMAYKLAELGLSSTPSVDSLNRAFDAMKSDGLIFPVEPKAEVRVEPQTQIKKKPSGSSVFGVVGGAGRDRAADKGAAQVPQITAEMSPREIMEAYKTAATASGQHPDELLYQAQRK